MKIQNIEIKGFRGLSDVAIGPLDPHLNLLIGVNGAGKSSILDAVGLLLTAFTSRLTTSNGKGSPIAAGDIKRHCKTCSLALTLDNNVKWTKLRSSLLEKDEESDFSLLNDMTKELRLRIDNDELDSVPVIIHYGVRRSVTDIPLRFPKTTEQSITLAYKDWIDSKASYRDIFPWLRNEEDYENELIRENPDARDRGLEALRKAMRNIFPDFGEMRVRRKPHLEVVVSKDGLDLPLNQLSDGEKCYIALVCDIVRRLSLANPHGDILAGDGIVLIDEVDLHLHPMWEQTIMENLHATFPNIQFIVSAHSPLVASHFDGNVYAISDGRTVQLPRLFGLDYSTILHDWMNTSPNNKEISSLISLYRAYTKNGMQLQANGVMERLTEKLGPDSPVLNDL